MITEKEEEEERGKELETTTKKTEQAQNRPHQGKVLIYLTYTMCMLY